MDSQTLQSNQLVFVGPFLGEFGWELSHWAPYVRWLRNHYKGSHIIASGYPGRHSLYYGIINEYWDLPKWFLDEEYEVDCYEALAPESTYGKLINHFKDLYSKRAFSQVIEVRTPRGFNHILRDLNRVIFQKLQPSKQGFEKCQKLIQEHGDKPCVVIFAREVNRTMCLNIPNNRPMPVSALQGALPSRNYPRSKWQDLFDALYEKHKDQVTFVIGGTKHGNCLFDRGCLDGVISLAEFDISESLDVTIAFLQKALCSISSQSGPSHVSLQTGCPSFIYGHEEHRHTVDDNPLKTDCVFFPTDINNYNDPVEVLFHDTSVYIQKLLEELPPEKKPGKKTVDLPIEINVKKKAVTGIKSVAMVGVFDIEGSTNVPFGGAFLGMGYNLNQFCYRSVAKNLGVLKRDDALLQLAKENDLMIFCKGNGISPQVYKDCSKHAITCWYMMDSTQHLENQDFFEYAKICDFTVVTTMEMKKALENHMFRVKMNKPVYHILQGVSPEEFAPVSVEQKLDVCFIGQRTPKRDKVLDTIKEWGFNIEAFGLGYSEPVYGKNFNQVCCMSKICLAINNTDGGVDSFSDRILRYMATGTFVVTEYSKNLGQYFKNGEDLVWFNTADELRTILTNFLSPDLAETKRKIAETGYQKVLNNYTWTHVAKQILNIAEKEI